MKKICYCVIGIINIKIIMQINSQNASKKIWFLFSLWSMIITDIVSLRKKFLLIIIAEIGIFITFGQCFKYVSTNSVDPREGQGKNNVFVVCVCPFSQDLHHLLLYPFSSCLQFRIFSQWQKIVLETNYSALFNRKLKYLILEFDSEQLTWGQ